MKRKGELTSTQVITIILAIIGFVLVGLGLYTIFEDDSLTNRDLCRLSILSRATVPSAGQQFVPLNCQTEKVCITVDDGAILGFGGKDTSCKQFAGEKNIRTVEVKVSQNALVNDKAVDTIQREVANAMYDCWIMTGQGKLDIFPPGDGTSTPATEFLKQLTAGVDLNVVPVKPSCVVCSRVAFSDALYESDKEFKFLKYIDFNRFLESQQPVPGTEKSYTSIFTGEEGTGYGSIAESESTGTKPIGYSVTSSNQIAVVFAQIKVSGETESSAFWNAMITGGIAGGIAAISSPGSVLPLPVGILKVLGVGAVATTLAYSAEANTNANHALSATTCKQFESTMAGQKGCSLVRLMSWDAKNVNSLCYNIEGNL
ncbi:MAG: hypothetical protein AABX10_04085 [Nanoarchaeota archaeon]